MFGLFKKPLPIPAIGEGIVVLANDAISSDSARALGTLFENFDASNGWGKFLESRGVSAELQNLHHRLFMHCVVQAVCTQFPEANRKVITKGAMDVFAKALSSYNFSNSYEALDMAFRGQHKFDPRIEPLDNPAASLRFLPMPNVGVIGAKYLIEAFAFPQMKNSDAFLRDFKNYSSTLCASIGTAHRAIEHLSKSYKF